MGLDWEPPSGPPVPSEGDPLTPLHVVVERDGPPGGTAD
jgi:hypothetical protein